MLSPSHMRELSTAPVDGTKILVHRRIVPGDADSHYLVVYYSEEDSCWVDHGSGDTVDLTEETCWAVHWQPVLRVPGQEP